MNELTKEEWIAELARLLCESQGAENIAEYANCREWAETLYENEIEDGEAHGEIQSPEEAHDLELSYG